MLCHNASMVLWVSGLLQINVVLDEWLSYQIIKLQLQGIPHKV